MEMEAGAIKYIHPVTPMTYPRNIPISLPALIKRIPYPVHGFCATQITDEEIKSARIIFMDVHWFFSLKGARDIVKRIKSLNPKCTVIAGGITATEFGSQIVDQFGVDFIVRGDGEIPLPLLVKSIIEGSPALDSIPNLIGKDGFKTIFSVKPYQLNRADFNENEFYDVDFFPYMKRELMALHRNNPGYPPFVFPFLLPFRGCPIECDFCAGAPDEQKKIFNRRVVYREAARLQNDIEYLGSQNWIKFTNCLLDFVTLMDDNYTQVALARHSRLKIQHEFTKAPKPEALEFFLSRFSGGMIHFSIDNMHLTSANHSSPDTMVKLIKIVQRKFKNYMPILDYSSVYAFSHKEYRAALFEIIKRTNCYIYDGSIWWSDFPKPDNKGFGDETLFQHYVDNPLGWKHQVANGMVTVMNFVDKTFPDPFKIALRKAYYGYYYKANLYLRKEPKVYQT